MRKLGRALKSEGIAYWELFQDLADIGHYIEIRIVDTWIDQMRQHERVTKNVEFMENGIRTLPPTLLVVPVVVLAAPR